MYRIKTLNKIATVGLDRFSRDTFEVGSDIEHPDGILLRSYDMHSTPLPPTVTAIARAGAGYNNIPVGECTERGIVVFNTPGANANSVKELILAGLFLSSRKIVESVAWSRALKRDPDEIHEKIETGKSQFTGPEIAGKKLGIIGLGAIGVLVANDAATLGMEVTGFDPFISIESAWGLSRQIKRASLLDGLLANSDYLTLNIPLTEKTEGFLNREKFEHMKRGVKILNFARGGLVHTGDLVRAMENGIVDRYVTDFPEAELLGNEKVLPIPHLGASTPEAENNCAVMAADQLIDFLQSGNIRNSVNFPSCEMALSADTRIVIANKNIPNMVGQITTMLAEEKINISDMLNRHRENHAYNIIDVENAISQETISRLSAIDGVVMVRMVNND